MRNARITGSFCVAVFALASLAIAQQVRDHRQGYWTVWPDIQNRVSGLTIDSGKRYRLFTIGGQIAYAEGGRIRLTNTSPNIQIRRAVEDPNYGDAPNVGHYVRLGEPIALKDERGGYLVYGGGNGLDLGWQRSSNFSLANAPGVYQWQWRSLPKSNTRDHRSRDIRTGEELALYNTIKKAYLISAPVGRSQSGRTLLWQQE